MPGQNFNRYAVVMGDLVHSERSPTPEKLHERFNNAVAAENLAQSNAVASPMTITLGDEFQGLTRSLVKAGEIARNIRLKLMADKIECRFAIGLVELTTELNSDKAWNMMGPGLSKARTLLNEKRANSLYRFSIPLDPVMEIMLEALGAGLTRIEQGWTDQQCADITALLSGMTAAELAKQRNVSVHTIYKVRSSGDFDIYLMQWQAINEALKLLDRYLERD